MSDQVSDFIDYIDNEDNIDGGIGIDRVHIILYFGPRSEQGSADIDVVCSKHASVTVDIPNGCDSVRLYDNSRESPYKIRITGGRDLVLLDTCECENAWVDFRGLSIDEFSAHSIDRKSIHYMGNVRKLVARNIDIGDGKLPGCIRSLACESLPEILPDDLLEVEYCRNTFNNIPSCVKTVHYSSCSNIGDLPRDLINLESTFSGCINFRELCPILETLVVHVCNDVTISMDLFPTTLKKLEISQYSDFSLGCKNMDFSGFSQLTDLTLRFDEEIEAFVPPPCIDILTIEWLSDSAISEEFFSQIGYVNKLVVYHLTMEIFDVLKAFTYGTLFLPIVPDFDVSSAPFPVIITARRPIYQYVIDPPGGFKGVITTHVVPDICEIFNDDDGKELVNYRWYARPFILVGRETVDGICGDVDVIHSIDPVGYISNAKSARN